MNEKKHNIFYKTTKKSSDTYLETKMERSFDFTSYQT